MKGFNKDLARSLFKSMNAQELRDPKKLSAISVKNLNSIVTKMKKTKSLMTSMKPKDAIKMNIVKLDKSETYPKEGVLPEYGLHIHLYQLGEQ